MERPFTITVTVFNSETRPVVVFPEVPGFVKKGMSARVTTAETAGKTVTNQVVVQNYLARAPGRFRLPPFVTTVNGQSIRSEAIMLTVQGPTSGPANTTSATSALPNDAAFLTLRPSKRAIYAGEGVGLTLSFCMVDNYPYELNFTALDRQLQAITKKIRPVNAWEENANIAELKPTPVVIRGKKYREFRLYQAVFFPLTARPLQLPAVSLQLERPRPVIGPPSSQADVVTFSSNPVTVNVRPLPPHPLRGRVPVGQFRLVEGLERRRVNAGQSVRYTFEVAGEGNIATLPVPNTPEPLADVTLFPPEERPSITHEGHRVTGRKTFAYFVVPHRNGVVWLADLFQWVYFNPQTARYDTLRSKLPLQVGGAGPAAGGSPVSRTAVVEASREPSPTTDGSIYAGIESVSSTRQPINTDALIRAVANALVLLMLIGMLFVFFRR